MCEYFDCSNQCPYKKCSANPSKNLNQILKKKNKGPLNLYSKEASNTTLLVFEAPGIDEWAKGEPICSNRKGSAAHKFNTEMAKQGKNKDQCDIVEAIRCFPGTSTKTKNNYKKDYNEEKIAREFCQIYLENVLTRKKYTQIVCFGKFAKDSVYGAIKKLVEQGNHYYANFNNVVSLPHPMYSKALPNDIAQIK